MKKIILMLVFLASVVSCGFCKDNVFKVGISPDYPPFEYVEDGKITGFDYDFMNALADEINIKLEFVSMDFSGLISALSSGKLDIVISGVTKTKERAKRVDFTKPYYKSVSLYVKLKTNSSIKSKEDLVGKKVAAQLGTVQADDIVSMHGVKAEINQDPMFFVMGVLSGKIDAFLIDEAVAFEYVKKYPELEIFDKKIYEDKGKVIAVRKGNKELLEKLDSAILKLEENGKYQEIAKKYNLAL